MRGCYWRKSRKSSYKRRQKTLRIFFPKTGELPLSQGVSTFREYGCRGREFWVGPDGEVCMRPTDAWVLGEETIKTGRRAGSLDWRMEKSAPYVCHRPTWGGSSGQIFNSSNNNSNKLHSSKHFMYVGSLMIRNLRCREVDNLSEVELVSSRALNLGSLAPGSMCLSLSCLPNDGQERTRVRKTLDYVCFFIPAIPKWVTPIWCVL